MNIWIIVYMAPIVLATALNVIAVQSIGMDAFCRQAEEGSYFKSRGLRIRRDRFFAAAFFFLASWPLGVLVACIEKIASMVLAWATERDPMDDLFKKLAKNELGSVIDIDALDDAPTGIIRVDVPEAWLTDGGTFEIDLPKRVTCYRCSGGGCDPCDRAGAFKTHPDGPKDLVLHLSPGAGCRKLVRCYPASSAIPGTTAMVMVVDMRPASKESPGIRRLGPAPA